jgi:hypothetical protein
MDKTTWNDLEVAPKSAVMQAAKQFAEAMGDTPQFKEFEQAYFNYRQDTEAQQAIQEFQKKQASLKALLILKAVGNDYKCCKKSFTNSRLFCNIPGLRKN